MKRVEDVLGGKVNSRLGPQKDLGEGVANYMGSYYLNQSGRFGSAFQSGIDTRNGKDQMVAFGGAAKVRWMERGHAPMWRPHFLQHSCVC